MTGLSLAQPFPTGPFADEGAYNTALAAVTSTVSGVDTVGVVRSIELALDDQVDGECWTNVTAVAARVRSELEQFGIAVYQERLAFRSAFAPLLQITGLGYRTSGGLCVVSASIEVFYWGNTRLGDLTYNGRSFEFENPILLWGTNSVFSSGSNVDDQMLSQAQEWVDTLIADIAKARRTDGVRSVLETWPNPKAMTVEEFNEFVESLGQEKP